MTIIFNSHKFKYEIESLCKMFFSVERFVHEYDSEINGRDDVILTEIEKGEECTKLLCTAVIGDKNESESITLLNSDKNYDNECERLLALSVFNVLTKLTGLHLSWGIMTGIKPVKYINSMQKKNYTKSQIMSDFTERYLVDAKKYELCMDIAGVQRPILEAITPKDYSLYVSIPFCPTRCSYCSFVSSMVSSHKAKLLMSEYLEKLKVEIEFVGKILREKDRVLKTIYIGGGTPTTLDENELEVLLAVIAENFDMSNVVEYTVEAGRPDTITRGKLETLKRHGVGRISINPQSFNDEVLKAIGRHHSTEDFFRVYSLAKEIGFDSINADLIAGLEADTLESFVDTVDRIIALQPENITVHALTVKRSSSLYLKDWNKLLQTPENARMIEYSQKAMAENGYIPYYLYRQKNTIQNLENVGYTKKNHECLYNIFIMDEVHDIISVGAGGVTKITDFSYSDVQRSFNFKYPHEYVSRFNEILTRKELLFNL